MKTTTARDQAVAIVDAAGAAGGIDEVRRIAERGWPDGDSELRQAVQQRAQEIVSDVDAEQA